MKKLGIIGGMSPASTATYYSDINCIVNQTKGGNTTAPILLYSVDFSEIMACQKSGDRQKAGAGGILAQVATDLEKIGADAVMITTNTMHKVAEIKFPCH